MTDSLSAIHHLIDDAAATPAHQVDDVYRSSNGDLWQLVRKGSPGHMLVRHTANAASGGAALEIPVEEFLAITASSPERAALCTLLGKIAAA